MMNYERYTNIFAVLSIICLAFFCYTPILSESLWYPLASLGFTAFSFTMTVHMETLSRKAKKKKRKNDAISPRHWLSR